MVDRKLGFIDNLNYRFSFRNFKINPYLINKKRYFPDF